MLELFDDRRFRALVIWCGIWQAFHLLVNVLYFLDWIDFPPAPPEGWTDQAQIIFHGVATSDAVQSLVSLLFVAGYLMRKRWCFFLGIVSLSTNVFNNIMFTSFTMQAGAWSLSDLFNSTTFIHLTWLPLLALFLWLCAAFARVPSASWSGEALVRAR